MTRDALWAELYLSANLRSGAKVLAGNFISYEDLLSDSLFKLFNAGHITANDQRPRKQIEGLVFITMRNMVEDIRRKKLDTIELGENYVDKIKEEITEPEFDEIEITQEEKEDSENLFGSVSGSGVMLMRQLHNADMQRNTNRKLWDAAQFTKLYLEMGSYRKVEEKTGVCYVQVRSQVKKFSSTMDQKKPVITVVTHRNEPASGMELYRLHYPYFYGIGTYYSDDFVIKRVSYEYMKTQPASALDSDVYVFSRLQHLDIADKVQEASKKMVIDVDDYWNLPDHHPLSGTLENTNYVSSLTAALKRADLVTVTTETLGQYCTNELGVEYTVIKNTIPAQDKQWHGEVLPSNKIRLGYLAGVFHGKDLFQLNEAMKYLYSASDLRGKFQVCLGGFNPNSEYVNYEKIMTYDYKGFVADSEYVDYLKSYTPMLDHISYNKPYRRIWARPLTEYGQGYREIDVALIPLDSTSVYSQCKSELKLIEAGTTGKAAIVSDCLPYSPYLKHESNCLSISQKRRDWYVNIRRMIKDKDLRLETAEQLSKDIKKHFNHDAETKKLAEALKQLLKK